MLLAVLWQTLSRTGSASVLRSPAPRLARHIGLHGYRTGQECQLKSHPIIVLRPQESCSLQVLRSVNLLYLQGLSVLYLLVRCCCDDSSICLHYTSSLSL
jgi:hypothetical protein